MTARTRPLGALLAALALSGCGADEVPARFHEPGIQPLDRPDTPGNTLQFNFEPGDVIETYGSSGGHFLVHFTRQGPNAVPDKDVDVSGVPDFVEEVAGVYEEVHDYYQQSLGFLPPVDDAAIADNGGDGRFDVYLVDFAGVGDGTFRVDQCDAGDPNVCAGYMVQENDFVGYGYPSTTIANRILGSHEFFHAVQAAYDSNQGSIMAEGTAVWATESFDPSLKDFEGFIGGFLDNPDRSLDVPLPGPVDPFSYGSAIFFQFLEERFGAGTVRALWERTPDGAFGKADPVWFEELDPMLQDKAQTSFNDAYVDFATWNLFTSTLADPARSYADGAGYAKVRMEDVEAPFVDDKLRVFYASSQYYRAVPSGREAMTAALVAPADTPGELDGLTLLLVAEGDSGYGAVTQVADPSAGVEVVGTAGAKHFVTIVVNGTQGGSSRRPALCIGTADEVADCRASLEGGGEGGAGGSGGSAADAPDDSGCGCRAAPTSPGPALPAALGLLALARYRRRRARAHRAASAAA